MLTHLSLFSGIGGLDLAAEAAGFVTVGQCEWADYPTKVLEKHWPDVPRWRDIRTLTGEDFYARTGLRTVDVISGGFPCQPFSVAGKQKGKGDDRYLWPEMLRVIRELTPRWIVGENVPGILRIAAGDVVADLERDGYDVAVFNFEAAAVGATHRRGRVFFVANTDDTRDGAPKCRADGNNAASNLKWKLSQSQSGGHGQAMADTFHGGGPVRRDGEFSAVTITTGSGSDHRGRTAEYVSGEWWSAEPDVGRVAHGIPNRVDRLKCLGNAVVPAQAYPIFKAIMEVETHEA